ncbi:MAG: translation initiation factor IF-2 [Acidobacteriota bacterium]
MATVRMYRVAELLSLSSQEAMTLLKQETGIDVKSASSSIEEIVARQFVERQARKRNIVLPHGPLFAETTVIKKPMGKMGGKSVPEPVKPTAAILRPRLIKTIKPPMAEEGDAPVAESYVDAPVESEVEAPTAAPEMAEEPETPELVADEEEVAVPAPPPPVPVPLPAPAPTSAPSMTVEKPIEHPVAAAPPVTPAPPPAPRPVSRIVPPSRRLRIEDPLTGSAPAARPVPVRPMMRVPVPVTPSKPAAATGTLARPPIGPGGAPGQRPSYPPARPPLGGPRPLPSQPIRPASPIPGRPAGAPRPTLPPRPYGPRQPRSIRREDRPMVTMSHQEPPPITKLVTLAEGMTVKDLADKLEVKVKDVLKKLIDHRMMLTINSTLDADTATIIARDFGAEVLIRSFEEELTEVETGTSDPADLVTRAPVVTVMGHVDHGKTTLLDAIRETKVAEREAGGITQHIGAYSVEVNKRRVVFLDTPGHEAFTMMRARGARVTDIVVLVVAADDGVMPQTREAIDHARAANVPIVVAVNKIDKVDANPERVKRELSDLGLMPEAWGGTTVTVEVSARQRKNLDQLLEMILLVADIADLKANPKRMAQGTVLEAKLDRGRGPVAHVLIQDGTISEGDQFIAGTVEGKVRALFDHLGQKLKKAGPSTPVEVLGLSAVPSPGDTFQVIDDPIKARQVVAYRQAQAKEKSLFGKGGRMTLESLQLQMSDGGLKELPIIIKADVQGSAEVLADSLNKLSDERVKIRTIHTGVGAINESDVLLAAASNAIIIGFNVRPDRNAADVAEREKVDIRMHSVIYHVTNEIKKAMTGLLEPKFKETRVGTAEIRQIFKAPKIGTIAGCMVLDGRIIRSGDAQARLLRDSAVVWSGKLASLKRFKDDVSEVKVGTECGIALERYTDMKVGDIIEVITLERIAQTL